MSSCIGLAFALLQTVTPRHRLDAIARAVLVAATAPPPLNG